MSTLSTSIGQSQFFVLDNMQKSLGRFDYPWLSGHYIYGKPNLIHDGLAAADAQGPYKCQ
jgi:hypothetical protein